MKFFGTEREFTTWLLKEARARGWTCAHFGSSMRVIRVPGGGQRVIPDRDASGFPDLVCARGDVLFFAELKMHDHRSKPKPAQLAWMKALADAGHPVYVWRPADQAEIIDVLDGANGAKHRLFEAGA